MAGQYLFGPFRLDVQERLLLEGEADVHLEPKSFDVLHFLLQNAGRLVRKQELIEAVWSPAVVTDNSLTRCIHQVRAALSDDGEARRFIETVPGSGYRFVAPVTHTDPEAPGAGAPGAGAPRRRHRLLIAGLALGAVTLSWWGLNPEQSAAPKVERLAVLPLANLTGQADQQYFVQGIHDALITELSRIGHFDVISRTSVMQYQDTTQTVREIGKALRVDAVVEGSVLRADDRVSVNVQLIGVDPEKHLWAERFNRTIDDVLGITAEIAISVASEVAIEMDPERKVSFASRPAVDGAAYDRYLLGKFHFEQRSAEGYRKAQALYREAMAIDPDFAPAYAGLAHTYGSAAIFGMRKPAEAMPMARTLAEQALSLDSSFTDAHLILAGVSFYWDWDWAGAETRVRRVLSADPSSAHAYAVLSEILSVTGRHDEALAAADRARALDPLPPTRQLKPALILYLSRDYAAAVEQATAGVGFYPEFWQGHWLLCLAQTALGRDTEALVACEAAVQHARRAPMALGTLGYVKARGGQVEAARGIAIELEQLSRQRYVGAGSIAAIYGALGELDTAFGYLAQAYENRDQLLVHADHYAFFDPLRSDARFHDLHQLALSARPH